MLSGDKFKDNRKQNCSCFPPVFDVFRNMCKRKKNNQQDDISSSIRGMRKNRSTAATSKARAGDIGQLSLDTEVIIIKNTINDMKSHRGKIINYMMHSSSDKHKASFKQVDEDYCKACKTLEENLHKVKDYAELDRIKKYIDDTHKKLHTICKNSSKILIMII